MTPGVHRNLPAEDYHAADGVSNSMLKHMDPTPAHFQAYLAEPKKQTTATVLGTLVHSMVLEPDKPLEGLIVKPSDVDFRTAKGKEWKRIQEEAGKAIISEEDHANALGMVHSISRHPEAKRIIADAETELSLFARNPRFDDLFGEDNPLLKARLDIAPMGNFLGDLKSCEDVSDEALKKLLYTYDYFQQGAFYLDIWNEVLPHDPKSAFVFIFVKKTRPYSVRVKRLKQRAINAGRGRYVQRLTRYVECVRANDWPDYPTDIEDIDIPEWAHAELERRAA